MPFVHPSFSVETVGDVVTGGYAVILGRSLSVGFAFFAFLKLGVVYLIFKNLSKYCQIQEKCRK